MEAGLVGLIGGILGSALGVLIGRQAIGALPAALLQGYESRTEYILPGYAIPVGVAACIVVSVAAAALAARQVYKVQPVEALAPVGASAADAVGLPARVVAGAFGVGLIAAAVVVASRDLGNALGGRHRADRCRRDRGVFRVRRLDRRVRQRRSRDGSVRRARWRRRRSNARRAGCGRR